MVIERLVRPRDPEEQTIIEELDEIFESGDLRKWASELGVRFILAIEDGSLRVLGSGQPDLTFAVEDPAMLLPWLQRRPFCSRKTHPAS